MDRVHEAAAVLNGIHDFKAFTHPLSLEEKPPNYSTLRNMEVSVEPGTGLLSSYTPLFAEHFELWNFVFKSRSFLFRQAGHLRLLLDQGFLTGVPWHPGVLMDHFWPVRKV